ncbi:hypothetical protein [Mesorhizobium carmichaelinearum]|uniref:hypothetical protein n=1 Tax=Mesorhizobium carmichaelinearum TaxID=1208188 RepID=UPI00117C2A25|nr:hypothetical protein [Mesorhizobium carmichaelinearum]
MWNWRWAARDRARPDGQGSRDGRQDRHAWYSRKPAPVDWTRVVLKMRTVKGIYEHEIFETWHKMLAILESGLEFRIAITHRLPVGDFKAGFEIRQSSSSGKIVYDWTLEARYR